MARPGGQKQRIGTAVLAIAGRLGWWEVIRIFFGLVTVHLMAVLVTFGLGFSFDPHSTQLHHWYAGLVTCVLTLLVHSIVMTYFVGTGRWVREVSDIYGFDNQLHARTWKAKVRAVPFAMLSMLMFIAASALGAAADPGATARLDQWMGIPASQLHLMAVLAATGWNWMTFAVEYRAICENAAIIETVMKKVQQVRAAKSATLVKQHV